MEQADYKLRELLRASRPVAELPPGFERKVWQRIEKREAQPGGLVELLSRWILTPRIAAGALAAVMVISAALGAARGVHVGDQEARSRYLASVDPSHHQR